MQDNNKNEILITDEDALKYEAAMRYMLAKLDLINTGLSDELGRKAASNISGRVKSIESIKNKLRRKNRKITGKNVHDVIKDIAGVRAVCFFVDDLYKFHEQLTYHSDITILKVKDYIKKPKKSGYRSLHLICRLDMPFAGQMLHTTVEIQLRTNAMDYWAELDNQLRYKKENESSTQIGKKLKSYADEISSIDKKMMKLRNRISQL
ncbi:MAG: GTP pyrophosphokinase [Oscillospiraceae bacterium]|nr:GTP pyrophosphokinase [Oscillospiraceae bacterium]